MPRRIFAVQLGRCETVKPLISTCKAMKMKRFLRSPTSPLTRATGFVFTLKSQDDESCSFSSFQARDRKEEFVRKR